MIWKLRRTFHDGHAGLGGRGVDEHVEKGGTESVEEADL